MFLKRLRDLRHRLALRLTLWYAGIFAVSSTLAFAVVYLMMVSIVQQRTDEDLTDDLEEFAAFTQTGGLERIEAEMMLETQGEEASLSYMRLWTSDGRALLVTDLSAWQGLGTQPNDLGRLDDGDDPVLETLSLPLHEHDMRRVFGAITPDLIFEIGQSLEEDDEFVETFLNGFLITLAAVLLLGGPIGWFMARRALSGLTEVTRTATEIAGGALERRVSVKAHGDELDQLAQAFNAMLDRIQALIVGMREMTDNLAHDLRSPVARLRTSAEMTLSNGGSGRAWQALAANTTEECDRLLEIINTTLDIAEAESGAAKLKLEDVNLTEVVKDACELFQTVAEDKRITVATDLPEVCRYRCDRQRLQRVVANLLDNALKYTSAGGRVEVSATDDARQVRLSVKDSGVGVAADELSRIFRRFYRCDRSRSEQGNGLGLSLALAFVRAHGGDIGVTSTPGRGSTFTLELSRAGRGRQRQADRPAAITQTHPSEVSSEPLTG